MKLHSKPFFTKRKKWTPSTWKRVLSLYFFTLVSMNMMFSKTSCKITYTKKLNHEPGDSSKMAHTVPIFTFSSYTEYVKRECIVITWVKKKNSLLLTNVYVLYVLEDKTSKNNFRLYVCLYVDFCCGHNIFRRN